MIGDYFISYPARILVLDTLNFSFWTPDPDKKFVVGYKGKTYTGYWSLVAAIDRALDVSMLQIHLNYTCSCR